MSRPEVLRCYKVLLRTRAKVFAGDSGALQLMAAKAREEFDKNRSLTDPEEIKKCLQFGWETAEVLEKTVIQGKLNESGNYEATIKKEHLDN
ncbi:hypothetical protein TYRP_012431 [Tyrophagus putrescentiae]|nr:hypothetical protein TYRP_012431 [Tyrophagus putrescentiae]